MSKWNEVKKLKDTARSKIDDTDLAKLAGDAIVGASNIAEAAEAVARRSGLTKHNGDISKLKVAKAVVQPRRTARRLLDASADEVRTRRDGTGEAPVPPE